MARERNKPTQLWIERTKYELKHEQELTIKRAYELGKIRGKKEQQAIDDAELHQRFEKVLNGQKWYLIETIPQLYVRWLMIEGEKPSWKEYAIKTMEEQIWE